MIHPTAIIHPGVRLGKRVQVGSFTEIHKEVDLGDGCIIESHCIVGQPTPLAEGILLRIGADALVRSHSIVYAGSDIGAGLVTGNYVTIREKSHLGLRCQIGSYTELQGDLTIGDDTRTQSSVFIPKHCKIGNCVWLMPGVILTNDPHPPSNPADLGVIVEDFAVIAARATCLPGVTIGRGSLVAAGSLVTRSVEPEIVVSGVPARPRGLVKDILLRDGSGPAYPWTRHFHRGYPPELISAWLSALGDKS